MTTLSEKRRQGLREEDDSYVYYEKDVREAIKKLKEELEQADYEMDWFNIIFEEVFGEELTK